MSMVSLVDGRVHPAATLPYVCADDMPFFFAVISDPEDPKFDLEKLFSEWEKDMS
jgi:hypothetical protein